MAKRDRRAAAVAPLTHGTDGPADALVFDAGMTLQDLRYVVALAEHCHFGRAAAACDISQWAVRLSGTVYCHKAF